MKHLIPRLGYAICSAPTKRTNTLIPQIISLNQVQILVSLKDKSIWQLAWHDINDPATVAVVTTSQKKEKRSLAYF